MTTFSTSIHRADPDSLEVIISRHEGFISLEIGSRVKHYREDSSETVEFTFFYEKRNGLNLHDVLVTLRALFPKHTFNDYTEENK